MHEVFLSGVEANLKGEILVALPDWDWQFRGSIAHFRSQLAPWSPPNSLSPSINLSLH